MRLSSLGPALLLLLHNNVAGASDGPAGLLPTISKADAFLATGQFGDAVRMYTEAIELSITDYLLYYKRATSLFSLQRHLAALEDYDKVLSLTSHSFDNAHLQKSRIFLKEGEFSQARQSLSLYLKAKKGVRQPEDEALEADIAEGEQWWEQTEKERKAQLWTACLESASQGLKVASHSVEIRNWRAECALASGDVESAVGDLSRLSQLLQPSTTLLMHIFRLSYFYTPASPASMNTLKQCLHYDPDSKPCLILHRLVKKFDRGVAQLDELLGKEDWRGIVKLLAGPGKKAELWSTWEEAMQDNVGQEELLPLVPQELLQSHASLRAKAGTTTTLRSFPPIPLPDASKVSPQRQHLMRAMCKAYTQLSDTVKSSDDYRSQTQYWCLELLTLSGCADDVDGLVGQAVGLLAKEEFEEAVRVLERAFEQGGRSDRGVLGRLQNAQRQLKQSRMKDYYKIVGVARDADARTIKKAYRKAAKLAHPDKGGSEAKMAALNEAYEVLSNPELRQRFDNGEDPMDPQQNGGAWGHGDPLAQFFAQRPGGKGPFSGGHQNFHFQYSG